MYVLVTEKIDVRFPYAILYHVFTSNGKKTQSTGLLLLSNLWPLPYMYRDEWRKVLYCLWVTCFLLVFLPSMVFMKSQRPHENKERKRRTEWRRSVELRRLKSEQRERRFVWFIAWISNLFSFSVERTVRRLSVVKLLHVCICCGSKMYIEQRVFRFVTIQN